MAHPLAVTDTHALIWFSTGQHRRLGRAALAHFTRTDAGQAVVYVPTMALVEVSELRRNGRIDLNGSTFEAWLGRLLGSRKYVALDLTVEMVAAANQLFAIPERGDRLIAAAAKERDWPLITRDPDIAASAQVDCVWD
jgi:PIN domain nuclease of toxin-antitoxin system